MRNYVKAVASAAGAVVTTWLLVAADRSLSFDEIGLLGFAVIGLGSALVTGVAPKNREV